MHINELNVAKEALKYRMRCAGANMYEEYESEIDHIKSLLLRSSEIAESNSLIVVGPRGCGKTTILQKILIDLMSQKSFSDNSLLVNLSGLIHTDDKLALKSITIQLDLENATHGKSFGSFAENLAFLLDCLKSGNNRKSKSIIFILDDFDIFCAHHNQTLLYNLFDVAQSAQAPICVVGLTYRLDVIELLEKRVKSRFSHRQVFLHPKSDPMIWVEKLKTLLLFPKKEENIKREKIQIRNKMLSFIKNAYDPSRFVISKEFQKDWNQQVEKLFKNKGVLSSLETIFSLDITLTTLKNIAWELISLTITTDNPEWNPLLVTQVLDDFLIDDKVQILSSLSVLELCLIIAMKHQSEIYDNDPFNFEMILNRFQKFSHSSTTMQGMERNLVFKAFEHIKALELIVPVSNLSSRQQKVFQMYRFLLTPGQVKSAVNKYQNLPVDVSQWALSSIV